MLKKIWTSGVALVLCGALVLPSVPATALVSCPTVSTAYQDPNLQNYFKTEALVQSSVDFIHSFASSAKIRAIQWTGSVKRRAIRKTPQAPIPQVSLTRMIRVPLALIFALTLGGALLPLTSARLIAQERTVAANQKVTVDMNVAQRPARDPGDKASQVEALIKDLRTVERGYTAAEALTKIGKPAIQSLIELLNDANPMMRANAAHILGKIGDASAGPALAQLIQGPNEDVLTLTFAAEALAALHYEGALNALVGLSSHNDPSVRTRAVVSLEKIGILSPEVLSALLDRANDPEALVRARAIDALGKFHDVKTESLLQEKSVKDPSVEVRASALGALSQFDSPTSKRILVNSLLDRNHIVRMAASKFLGEQEDGRLIEKVIAHLESLGDKDAREVEWLNLLVRARSLGIRHAFRFNGLDTLRAVVTARENLKRNDAKPDPQRPLVVVIFSRVDWSKATYKTNFINDFLDRGYDVLVWEVARSGIDGDRIETAGSREDDPSFVFASLESTRGREADYYVTASHANETMLPLGIRPRAGQPFRPSDLKYTLNLRDEKALKHAGIFRLKKSGKVILIGCKTNAVVTTGAAAAKQDNVANMLRRVSDRDVWASPIEDSVPDFIFEGKEVIELKSGEGTYQNPGTSLLPLNEPEMQWGVSLPIYGVFPVLVPASRRKAGSRRIFRSA